MLVNYYRLTSYLLPFKSSNDCYIEGTVFENVYKLYEFDKKLRHLISSQIETIEIMFRMRLAYHHSHNYGPLGYLSKNNFMDKMDHEAFLMKIDDYINRQNKNPIVKHHNDKYEGTFPLWVIIEFFDFAELSKFYANMHTKDKKTISREMNISHDLIGSWLYCLTHLRNCCAHHERLYNNTMISIPKTPKNFEYKLSNKIFDYILILKFLIGFTTEWKNDFIPSLFSLIENYKEYLDTSLIGFDCNWEEIITSRNKYICR